MTALEKQLLANRFEIVCEVGRGAAGVVYRAHDVELKQAVALKMINETEADGQDQERFLREGLVLSEIHHEGIVGVVAYGSLDQPYRDDEGRRFGTGTAFIAMEWLAGEDLAQRQKRAPLSMRQSVEIIAAVSDALAAAHDVGVVHRDIKPSNIFLTYGDPASMRSGGKSARFGTLRPGAKLEDIASEPPTVEHIFPKILDFGVAATNDADATGAGGIVGTPAYMAPEQAQGDALRTRAATSTPSARRSSSSARGDRRTSARARSRRSRAA